MKRRIFWALVGLNVLLLGAMLLRSKPAAAAPRVRADYIMIPGSVAGSPNDVVYVIDTDNGKLSALVYDDGTKRVTSMPPIDLGAAFGG
jgi:sugar lactone lactonase YvrE